MSFISVSLMVWPTLSWANTTAPILPAAELEYIEKHLPGVLIGPAEGLPPIVDSDDWFPLEESTFVYEIPHTSGKTAAITLEQTGRAPGTPVGTASEGWVMTLPNKTTRYLSKDPESLEIAADIARHYGLLIKLDPHEPLVKEKITPGQSITREILVDVYDVSNPEKRTHSGKVVCTWTDLGGHTVKVPAGTFDTRLLRVTYEGKVGGASVRAKKYTFLAHGIGQVAFTDVREISAFVFYHNNSDRSGMLKSVHKEEKKASDPS